MENPQSPYRRELNKFTLVFSHILAELKAVWPGGVYQPDVIIVKHEARDFWRAAFADLLIVPWGDFAREFGKIHGFCSTQEEQALKKTVDLLENDHVSRFEFDIFTRLFQPWKQIMNTWNVIVVTHPGYRAFMTYDEVEDSLKRFIRKPGSYVFRLSCTRLGQWAIGFVTSQYKIVQTIPQSKSLYQALIDGMAEKVYLFPAGQDKNPDIRQKIRVAPADHIKVTQEQHDIYVDMDSTFELCKICSARSKNTRIEPCGHLLCAVCLNSWIEQSNGHETLCPFCRKTVLSTECVVIDPFSPEAKIPHTTYSALMDDDDDDNVDDYESVSLAHVVESGASTASSAPLAGSPSSEAGGPPRLPPRKNSISSSRRHKTQDPGLQAPPNPRTKRAVSVRHSRPLPPPAVAQDDAVADACRRLMNLGFSEPDVRKALKVAKNDVNIAADILLSFGQ